MSNIVYIGLGSNIEPRSAFLAKARPALASLGIIQAVSSIYETKPLTLPNKPVAQWYLNQVICLNTKLVPQALLNQLKTIEEQLGRIVRPRWTEREIDLDILLYNDEIIATVSLVIPHPGLAQRKFVLEPLAEIAPNLIEPRSGKTIKELLTLISPLTP